MHVGVSNTVCLILGNIRENRAQTVYLLLDPVAGAWLVVHQAFGRYVTNDLIPLCWLHLHSDILQDLIIQGVGTVKLSREGENKDSLKLSVIDVIADSLHA